MTLRYNFFLTDHLFFLYIVSNYLHQARLRELRRTRDPKRKEKFFNSKQLLAGDASVCFQHGLAFLSAIPSFSWWCIILFDTLDVNAHFLLYP
jgi:hypothetical protein